MKVKELIKKLEKFDLDTEIVLFLDDGYIWPDFELKVDETGTIVIQ